MKVKVKRAYDPPDKEDGCRVLVDRLWPRGIRKEDLKADLWLKDIAPSEALRKWFSHDPERWDEFRIHYFEELGCKAELIDGLMRGRAKTVTLLYGAKDERYNNAVALREYMELRLKAGAKAA